MNNKVEFLVPNIILVNNEHHMQYQIFNDSSNADTQLMYIHSEVFENVELTDQMDYIESICDQMRINFKRLDFIVSTKYRALDNSQRNMNWYKEDYPKFEWEIKIKTLKEI